MLETSPIVLTCDAGIAVVLLGDSDLVSELGFVAEDLLASGAQVELVTGIERAPARLAEAVRRATTPTLFVYCRRGASESVQTLQALFEQLGAHEHRWLDFELDPAATAVGTHRIIAALSELAKAHHGAEPTVPCDTAIDAMFDDVAHAPADAPASTQAQEVSGVVSLAEPRLLGPPKSRADRPRRKPKASLLLALAAASAAVVIAGAWPRELPAPSEPSEPTTPTEAIATPVAVVSTPLVVAAPVARAVAPPPAVPRDPAPVAIAVPVLVPVVGAPTWPAPARGDHRTQLDIAIERQHVTVHAGLVVAEPILGERPWAEAMTACRARPFWHVRGWRVPTRKELVTLARAGLLPKARVWSATRADRRNATSFVVDGHDGAVSAEPRTEASAVTICVKRR